MDPEILYIILFYHTDRIAHFPMEFYYPGKAKNGDLPPRKGFAEQLHPRLLDAMPVLKEVVNQSLQERIGDKRVDENVY